MIDKYFRHELKYFIHLHAYLTLRQHFKLLLKPDQHANSNGEYHVRSLYFDDIDGSSVSDKLSGIRVRKKYRIRIYNFSDILMKLECKYKIDQYICKEVVPISRQEYESIVRGDIKFLRESRYSLLKEFYVEINHHLLKPIVIVSYIREVYTLDYQHNQDQF